MPAFDPTNLLWERRYRGSLPCRSHCVDDEGHTLILTPDELAARTYQLLRVSPSGQPAEVDLLTVETLHEFETSPDGRLILARTSDDLYLFHRGHKSRFLGDRRVSYNDVDLAADADVFVCSYSDLLGSSHALALGEVGGELLWSKDQPAEVLAVAVAGDGSAVFGGLQDGTLLAYDRLRNELWRRTLPGPIVCVQATPQGSAGVAGCQAGEVVRLDPTGEWEWRVNLGEPVVALATDADLRWTLAATGDRVAGQLFCLGGAGEVLWQRQLEGGPTGVAMSPSGARFCVSLQGGTVSAYAAEFDELEAESRRAGLEAELTSAKEGIAAGDPEGARQLLLPLLQEHPARLEVAEALREATLAAVRQYRAEADAQAAMGLHIEAMAALDAARQLLPADAALFNEWRDARRQAVDALRTEAEGALAADDPAAAAESLARLLELDALDLDGRRRLAEARSAQAAQLLAAGDDQQRSGDPEGALALWRQAVALAATPEIEARLREGEIAQCMALGKALYEDSRQQEAAFQFRKALALDPNHAEARRFLGYAEDSGRKSLIEDRFSRLE